MKKLEEYVVSIPDFPEAGIIFRDVTSVLQDAEGLQLAVDTMQEKISDLDYDVVVGPESRGFIFGTPIAYNKKKPFVLIRKAGKLPRETVSVSYELEYGSATIEMHKDSIKPGQKVLIVDDLIATGGTTGKACKIPSGIRDLLSRELNPEETGRNSLLPEETLSYRRFLRASLNSEYTVRKR